MSVRAQKRAEYEARKAAGVAQQEHGWKFGNGQTARQEQAEMERAKIEGRGHEYNTAQTAARAREQAEPKPKRARKPKAATPSPPARNLSPLPSVHGDPASYGNALLADHARGRIAPVSIPVPHHLPSTCADVARLAALVVGLRLSCGDERPAPLGRDWIAGHLGMAPSTVARALGALVRIGFLTHEGNLPRRAQMQGTALYGIPGVTAPAEPGEVSSDRVPVAGGEPGPVPVEAQHGVPGSTVEPRSEPVDEPGVSGAVGGGPAGDLDGPPAVSSAKDSRTVVGGHGPGRYARRPTAEELLARALEGPASARGGSIRDDAFWLACQLRDHGHDEHGDAYEALLDFAAQQPARFTGREALHILSNANGRPPRPPWGSPTGRTCAEVER